MMITTILTYLNLMLAVALIIWVALILVQKRKSPLKRYIVSFNLLMAYVLLHYWSSRSGVIHYVPGLAPTKMVALFAIGPVVYLYMSRLLGIDKEFKFSHLIHFIPAIISVCILIIHYILNISVGEYQLNSRPGIQHYDGLIMRILDSASDLCVVLYLLLSSLRVGLSLRTDRFKEIKELRMVDDRCDQFLGRLVYPLFQ